MGSSGEERSERREIMARIYSDFMLRITKYDELVLEGGKLLTTFRQALGILVRPPIGTSSNLVEHILKDCGTKQVLSYIAAGSVKADDGAQSVSKSELVVGELESLVKDAASLMEAIIDNCEDACSCFDSSRITNEENLSSQNLLKLELTNYASTMALTCSMVKLDYTMQARIVSSLGLKSSPGELETYSEMWSLRPYIDDEAMQNAWSLLRL